MTPEERRKFKRVEFREPVQYRLRAGSDFVGCVGCDIGAGGLGFTTEDFIPLETELSVNTELKPESSISTKGRVVWIQLVPHSERYQVGLKFAASESLHQVQKQVEEYIESYQSE